MAWEGAHREDLKEVKHVGRKPMSVSLCESMCMFVQEYIRENVTVGVFHTCAHVTCA